MKDLQVYLFFWQTYRPKLAIKPCKSRDTLVNLLCQALYVILAVFL